MYSTTAANYEEILCECLHSWLTTLQRVWRVTAAKYVSQDVMVCTYLVVWLTIHAFVYDEA
jgi:hypothetical protein